MKIDHDTPEL